MSTSDFTDLPDAELVSAWVQDASNRPVGVDYFLNQEVERRGLSDVALKELLG